MDDKRIQLLRDAPVNKAITKLAIPAIIGMLVMAIYNFVDAIWVSWYDPLAPGALQVVMPVMLIASSIGLSFGIGGGSYISRLLGGNNIKKAEKVIATVFVTGIVLGIITTILNYLFIDQIFGIWAVDAANLAMINEYGTYVMLGYTFMILNMILNNILRSEGSAKYSMIGMSVGAILNIIIDPIFIFVFKLGVGGAAMATTLSNIVSFIVLLSMYRTRKSVIRLNLKNFSFDLKIYKEVLIVGLPILFKQLLFSFSMGLLNSAATNDTWGSQELISTIGNMVRIVTIPSYIVFGFGQGFQPVAGYNYGADKPERVMDSFKYTVKMTTIIMFISSLFLAFFGFLIIRIFNTTVQMTEYAIMGFRYFAIGLLFLGITNTITVFFQALGKGTKALLMSISRQGLFFIPAILILPSLLGLSGVLVAQPVADVLSALMGILLFLPYLKKEGIEKLFQKTHQDSQV